MGCKVLSLTVCLAAAAAVTAASAKQAGAGLHYLLKFPTINNPPLHRGVEPGDITIDSHGTIYGVTSQGGGCANIQTGCGIVYALPPGGKEKVLHVFSGSGGITPNGLILDASGNLYGTTFEGGMPNTTCELGCGTLYTISSAGVFKVLYAFDAMAFYPVGNLVRDANGDLYGVTSEGGAGGGAGGGTIFRLSVTSGFSILHAFGGGTDGTRPGAGLTLDAAGNLYGTTMSGGRQNYGTVFRSSKSGVEQVVYAFTGGADGLVPTTQLSVGPDGALYGTAAGGGLNEQPCNQGYGGCGTVYKITPAGSETTLHEFSGGADGCFPSGRLVVNTDQSIYGLTYYCGSSRNGVFYMINPNGAENILYTFTTIRDPNGGLVEDASHAYYGTVSGFHGDGIGGLFKFSN